MTWQKWTLRAMFLVAAATLVACSGSQTRRAPTTQTYFINPQYGSENIQQRLAMDRAECLGMAYRTFPDPPPPPQGQSGTINLWTPNGPVSGTFQSQPQSQGFQPQGFLGGYQYAQQRSELEGVRGSYAVNCLAAKGWQQQQR